MSIAKIHNSLAVSHLLSSCVLDAAQSSRARRASPGMQLMQTAARYASESEQSQSGSAEDAPALISMRNARQHVFHGALCVCQSA